ncbi:MAG: hypothetical protein Ct9H300mP9_2570 [Candidatus Neomarinimicrobiota bacterium]|nr:MAG: hypothetical protein Ct9H300mP9_2570 [Candidatus Neomarinimicrobiota bacterium]
MKLLSEDISILRWLISVLLTGILTNLLSSSATVAVVGPIVLNMGGDPIVMGFLNCDRVGILLFNSCCFANMYDHT